MKAKVLSILDCEHAIGVSANGWVGRCYEIASAIHASGLVSGRVVYGHWTGPVSPRSSIYRRGVPFYRHGWIVIDDDSGAVFDPTRWAFEAVKPYLFVGEPIDPIIAPCETCDLLKEEHDMGPEYGVDGNCGAYQPPAAWPYDEGGNKLRAETEVPMPSGRGRIDLRLRPAVIKRIGVPRRLTKEQVVWLANRPYDSLGNDAPIVYAALVNAGFAAWIPIDNRLRAEAKR